METIALMVAAAVIAILALFVIISYNQLVSLRVKVESSWSDMTVQLKRRSDLIPALVSTVKGYATHESEVFDNITKARSQVNNATTVEETAASNNMMQEALKSLFAVAEAYPDLKANANFLDLQSQLSDTENKIMASRRFYNGTVRDYNTKQQLFPVNLIARMLKFSNKEFYNTDDKSIHHSPNIDF